MCISDAERYRTATVRESVPVGPHKQKPFTHETSHTSGNINDQMKIKSIAGSLTLAVLLVVPSSFAQKQDKNHQDAFVGDPNEAEIAKKVRHELVMLPYYNIFDDLAFRIDGGTVTLLGAVVNPTLKDEAGRVVKKVAGVEQVVNNIEVLPVSPMDNQIRTAEYRAIYGDPSISTRYGFRSLPSIHIIVKNGHVTLEGVVANQGDKNLIGIKANGVPNVFSVTNDLVVENEK
jgi:hyperosmotically inducible protein